MNSIRRILLTGTVASAALGIGSAHASLMVFQTYVGNYGVSTDGFGSTSNAGSIGASVPFGSTVVAAYLYTSLYGSLGSMAPGGTLNGSTINYATALGVNEARGAYLQAYRADVTGIVAPVINAGAGGAYSFSITETLVNQDGEALVVVYQNASRPTQTIGILDGFSAVGGDSTSITFGTALDPTAPGFSAELRIGDGFSAGGQTFTPQVSTITVNGSVVTTVAGSNDDSRDASIANGNLITVGGDNDPFTPANPAYTQDHERYNLVPYIRQGDTTINISTLNPSGDDNIFLAVVDVSGEGQVNMPTVPEPVSLALLGTGLAGLAAVRRRSA